MGLYGMLYKKGSAHFPFQFFSRLNFFRLRRRFTEILRTIFCKGFVKQYLCVVLRTLRGGVRIRRHYGVDTIARHEQAGRDRIRLMARLAENISLSRLSWDHNPPTL
ncbi:hypothetical protein TgHK011_006566 [Trichoderma gracile]|nr:hypothetical protein TgHK011_006566 [Trichoderma gracile]